MDWNKFMQALQESGVEEITLKFRENVADKSTTKKVVSYEDITCAKSEQVVQPEKTKQPKVSNSDALKQFRENHKHWNTVYEICDATGFSHSAILNLLKEYEVPSEKFGKVVLHDTEAFWVARQTYEDDIIAHDGERQGNVKFVGTELSKLIGG
jgi:RNA-binding protein YlmH